MTPEQVFSIANTVALLGWVMLIAGRGWKPAATGTVSRFSSLCPVSLWRSCLARRATAGPVLTFAISISTF